MSRLVCLLKGCAITKTKEGFVICPDCGMNYCWDRDYIGTKYVTPYDQRYPFDKWIPCGHGAICKNRRLHKGRQDRLTSAIYESEKTGKRHERLKLPLT